MKLFEIIDYLFKGTRYGSWVLGILGILGSLVLIVTNLGLGLSSSLVFVATLFLSVAVVFGLAPKKVFEGKVSSDKKLIIVVASLVISLVITGLVYFTNGGFPELNLLFI